MSCVAFFRGMGVGLVAGAAFAAAVMTRRQSMKTCVGRGMQSMGNAVDRVLGDIICSICG